MNGLLLYFVQMDLAECFERSFGIPPCLSAGYLLLATMCSLENFNGDVTVPCVVQAKLLGGGVSEESVGWGKCSSSSSSSSSTVLPGL